MYVFDRADWNKKLKDFVESLGLDITNLNWSSELSWIYATQQKENVLSDDFDVQKTTQQVNIHKAVNKPTSWPSFIQEKQVESKNIDNLAPRRKQRISFSLDFFSITLLSWWIYALANNNFNIDSLMTVVWNSFELERTINLNQTQEVYEFSLIFLILSFIYWIVSELQENWSLWRNVVWTRLKSVKWSKVSVMQLLFRSFLKTSLIWIWLFINIWVSVSIWIVVALEFFWYYWVDAVKIGWLVFALQGLFWWLVLISIFTRKTIRDVLTWTRVVEK